MKIPEILPKAAAVFLLLISVIHAAPARTESPVVSSEIQYPAATGMFSFDGGIRQLRYNAMPGFRSGYDDCLRYAPAAVMLGMKAFGYDSRTCWGRMLVSDAFSAAVMTGAVIGIKYTVRRPRPDGISSDSFPSGHTATAFMIAAMMDKEYGWRSPWFSFGAYAAATATALGRIMNDRHWASDIIGGAVIGVASTYLGYFIADRIFKDRHLCEGYTKPEFLYDPQLEYYEASLFMGYRFFPGNRKKPDIMPKAGSTIGIQAGIPLGEADGLCIRTSANSMTFASGESSNMYNILAGGYWKWHFTRRISLEGNLMIGYAWHKKGNGIDFAAGPALSFIAGNNLKIKAFAEYETFSFIEQKPFIHTAHTGISAAFFW